MAIPPEESCRQEAGTHGDRGNDEMATPVGRDPEPRVLHGLHGTPDGLRSLNAAPVGPARGSDPRGRAGLSHRRQGIVFFISRDVKGVEDGRSQRYGSTRRSPANRRRHKQRRDGHDLAGG
jgi:hypothetical protein